MAFHLNRPVAHSCASLRFGEWIELVRKTYKTVDHSILILRAFYLHRLVRIKFPISGAKYNDTWTLNNNKKRNSEWEREKILKFIQLPVCEWSMPRAHHNQNPIISYFLYYNTLLRVFPKHDVDIRAYEIGTRKKNNSVQFKFSSLIWIIDADTFSMDFIVSTLCVRTASDLMTTKLTTKWCAL